MKRKLLPLFVGGLLGSSLIVTAQDFKFVSVNPLEETVNGTTILDPEDENGHIIFNGPIENISQDPISIQWTFLSTDTTLNPAGWIAYSLCDNNLCRYRNWGGDDWYTGLSYTTNPILPGDQSIFELALYIPETAEDGTGYYAFAMETANQKDTFTFQITKQATSISMISVSDERVRVYPNPAQQEITIQTDASLQASSVQIYNMIGREIMNTNVPNGKETLTISIDHLSAGMYFARIADYSGKVVTTRKFIKN